jgi:hypothetical protein
VSLKSALTRRLRVVFVCSMLQWGAMIGVPMRPDEIQELMHQMNQRKMAHVLPTDEDEGDKPHDDL